MEPYRWWNARESVVLIGFGTERKRSRKNEGGERNEKAVPNISEVDINAILGRELISNGNRPRW